MCPRCLAGKICKKLLILLAYLLIYILISGTIQMTPETVVAFVSDVNRVGDKYSLIFLVAPNTSVFSDLEAADVFTSRRCGKCVLTNNVGFLPVSEYDAVLVQFDNKKLSEPSVVMDPEKVYLIEATKRCLSKRFKNCIMEPKLTSLSTRESLNLCQLCDHLQKQRKS